MSSAFSRTSSCEERSKAHDIASTSPGRKSGRMSRSKLGASACITGDYAQDLLPASRRAVALAESRWEHRREAAVDEIGDALFQVREHRVFLGLREVPRLDGRVEVLLRLVHEGLNQAVDRLAVILRDLGERLPVA